MKIGIDNQARLAFGVVLLLGVAAIFAWKLTSSARYTTYEIRTHDVVSGLIADAPVEYHGVDVGKVKSVELIDSRSIRILLRVENRAPVTAATVATITTRGLAARGFTGYVYVALEDAGTDFRGLVAQPGEPFPVLATAASKSASLDTAISQVNQNVQFLTERVQSVLDDQTVASLKESVDSLQRITKTLADNNARLASLIISGERAGHQLQPLLKSSKDTVRALQEQVLPEAHKALTSVNRLSSSLDPFATKVSRDPSVIVRGVARPPPGPGESK